MRPKGLIYESLNPNGVFCNADVVLGSNDNLQNKYMLQWRNFMQRKVSIEEIEKKWIKKYYEEDRPTELTKHLDWLKEIGFVDIDIIWKYYNFAVYGGYKK